MQKKLYKKELLNISKVNTRLHQAPFYKLYKPNNKNAKLNILYRGAKAWNTLSLIHRNKEIVSFASWLKMKDIPELLSFG